MAFAHNRSPRHRLVFNDATGKPDLVLMTSISLDNLRDYARQFAGGYAISAQHGDHPGAAVNQVAENLWTITDGDETIGTLTIEKGSN